MNKIILNGLELDGYTIEIKETGVVTTTPPTPEVKPTVPLPPVVQPQNLILKSKTNDYPAWVKGNAYNVVNAPEIQLRPEDVLAIEFSADDLNGPNGIGYVSTYSSTPCEVCISDKPWVFETGYMVPYVLDTTGKSGIKFLSASNPLKDADYAPYGYKRLPQGNKLYVNIRGYNGAGVTTMLLYGN